MQFPTGPVPFVFAARDASDDRALRRAVERGEAVRVRRGAYVDGAAWRESSPEERYLLRIAAVGVSRRFTDVFSHQSAAVLHGLTLLTPTEVVHVSDPSTRSTRTSSGLVVHAGVFDPAPCLDRPPFLLTSRSRTLADLLFSTPFRDGVVALDAALHEEVGGMVGGAGRGGGAGGARVGGPSEGGFVGAAAARSRVADLVAASPRVHGRSTAERALAFADPRSESVGESLSRVVIAELGFAAPILQEGFDDAAGLIGFTDFWWPHAGVAGEFDGFVKNSDPRLLRGSSPSEVAVAERHRERRLEALPRVRRVARWVWSDLMQPERLFRLLSDAGVPRV